VLPARNFVGNLYFIEITPRRWLKRATPFDPIASVRGTAKMREAGPHELILLHRGQKLFSYESTHRRETRLDGFAPRRWQVR
jgi:hypothetical protein